MYKTNTLPSQACTSKISCAITRLSTLYFPEIVYYKYPFQLNGTPNLYFLLEILGYFRHTAVDTHTQLFINNWLETLILSNRTVHGNMYATTYGGSVPYIYIM